jgi:hypothetical chaperone protein
MKPVAYGIDFGTTNSAIAIAYEDRVEVLPVEPTGSPDTMLPSLVYLDRYDNQQAGATAAETFMLTGAQKHQCSRCPLVEFVDGEALSSCRQARPGGGCNDSRLLAGLKFDLAEPSFTGTHSWAEDFPIDELVAIVLKRLKREADRSTGADVKRAVLGYPLAFPGAGGAGFAQQQATARTRLERAAADAGFDEIHLLPEPQAAALVEDTDRGTVLATDFGGGTFDAAVMEFSEDEAVVTALKGVAVGGELLDAAVFQSKVAPEIGLDFRYTGQSGAPLRMPQALQRRFYSLSGLKHLMVNPDLAVYLRTAKGKPGGAAVEPLEQLLYGGHAYGFYRAVEGAKIALSTETETRIAFRRPGLSMDIPITRAEFDTVAAPYIDSIEGCVHHALAQANKTPGDISYVVSTGGSSRIPAYRDMLCNIFGSDRVVDRDPFTTVVTGLGYEAQGRWA